LDRNVLLITLDQWRGDCLQHLGHPSVRTPHLTGFARQAVTFARHFAQGAPCAPSRMSLYSSRYVFNHRVVSNETPVDPSVDTLAEYLRDCGVDPWAAGHTSTVWSPQERSPRDPILVEPAIGPGWSTIRAFDGDRRRYLEYLHARGLPRRTRFADLFSGVLAATSPSDVPASPVPIEWSETAWLVDGVIDHLRYSTDRPWGIHLSVFKPHPPFFPSAEYARRAAAISDIGPVRCSALDDELTRSHPFFELCRAAVKAGYLWPGLEGLACDIDEATLARGRRAYYALCEEVDHQVGRVLSALEESGQADRTLVIITADHGEMLGDQSLWGKTSCFPQAFHIPLLIRDPRSEAEVTRGSTLSDLTENVDLLPTVMDWLGRPAQPHWDGQSLLPYLETGRHARPRAHVSWEFDFRHHAAATAIPALSALPVEERCLAAVLSAQSLYVHFPSLPSMCMDVKWDVGVDVQPLHGSAAADVRDWGRDALLALRMARADNRRTHLVQTKDGIRSTWGQAQSVTGR
jgi:arylsulfatase A-like enzyme